MRKIIFIWFYFPSIVIAQDLHFSQWMHNPLFLTPTLSGSFEGQYRANIQQRGQWESVSVPFSTTSLGLDMKIKDVGLGAQLLFDKSGTSTLKNTQCNFSLSANLLGYKGGLQLGFATRSIDYTQLIFPENNEAFPSSSTFFLDIGAGLSRDFTMSEEMSMITGVSIFHINKPNRSLIEKQDFLMPRFQLFTKIDWDILANWQLQPSIMYMKQNTYQSCFVGSKIQYDISEIYYNDLQLEFGTFYRLGDAINFLLGLNIENTYLAFSYDWNISDLIPASNSLGAWEFSLTHIINQSIPKRPDYKVCPVYL